MGSDWFFHIFIGRQLRPDEAKDLWQTRLRESITSDDDFDRQCLFLECEPDRPSPAWLTRENGHPIRLLCPTWNHDNTNETTEFDQFKWFVVQEYLDHDDYVGEYDLDKMPKPFDERYRLMVVMDFS